MILAGLELSASAPGPQPKAQLRPGTVGEVARPATLFLPGGAVFILPPQRARLRATLDLRPAPIHLISFALDTAQIRQDLLAFIASDGALLALERADVIETGANGASQPRLSTRIAMLADRSAITLQRLGQAAHTTPHEQWTDYLRPTPTQLENAPPRPVQLNTLQHAISLERSAIAAQLPQGSHHVPLTLLQTLQTPPFAALPLGEGPLCRLCQKA